MKMGSFTEASEEILIIREVVYGETPQRSQSGNSEQHTSWS